MIWIMIHEDCLKSFNRHPEGIGETIQFFIIFQEYIEKLWKLSCFFQLLNINALHPMMLKHCNLITEEGGIIFPQKLLHYIYDLIIVSKMVTMQVGFEFRKQ